MSDCGIDVNLPIFKFDKPLTRELLCAFKEAGKEEKFNLVLPCSALGKMGLSALKGIENLTIYSPQNVSVKLLEMINKLNINYASSSNYNLVFKDKFFKVNETILNPKYKEFSLEQVVCFDGIKIFYREFVLNGSNFFVRIENCREVLSSAEIELNLPLLKGYYYFKKQGNSVSIENLISKEKFYLNFIAKNVKFGFSCVDGLENSTFSCVNVKVRVPLKAKEKKMLFFNFGNGKICLKSEKEVEIFERFAKRKTCEIFNVKVKTKNPKFDLFFNSSLPKKIWINWLNLSYDEELERKYLTLKRLFVKGKEKLDFVPFRQIGLREIGIFNGEYYKKIFIVQGNEQFLKIGQTSFFNVNGLTMNSLKKSEPISLSFGS